jgi:UDP-N-acetylmuramoylalanine--D-glutamate ligase
MSGPVVVIGLGRSGMACARTLAAEGHAVLVVDRADGAELRERAASLPQGVRIALGGYGEDVVDGSSLVCPSPGVDWHAPELERARRLGIPVRSEIDLVFERCPGLIVGITGTNGKTTTTALIGELLRAGGVRTHVGGNIGEPMLDRLRNVHAGDWVVLELSSFQLESASAPRCAIACVLNVTPDHLDRHRTFEAYAATKAKLVRFAVDDVVLGHDDPTTRAMAAIAPCRVRYFGTTIGGDWGVTLRDGGVVSVEAGRDEPVLAVREIPLFGPHNVLNVLAAVAAARAAGVPPDRIAAGVRRFSPVPHRLQTVLEQDGVLWVNDSKATNAESAIVGLGSFGDRPIVWIGGGQSKGVAPDALADAVVAHARFAVLNGATAGELDRALAARGFDARTVVPTLADAVAAAARAAAPGDVVLLSPGYASFDQFTGFEQRGDAFAIAARREAGAPATGPVA